MKWNIKWLKEWITLKWIFIQNILPEAIHFLLRPRSLEAGESSSLSCAPEGKHGSPMLQEGGWGPWEPHGDLRGKDWYPSRDNTSSGPEFGMKFIEGLRNIFLIYQN